MRISLFTATAMLVLSMIAPVASAATPAPLQFDDVRTEQATIREGVQAGSGVYADMPSKTRNELLARQEALLRTIENKQSLDQLNQTEQTDVLNALGWIKAAVTRSADDRLVCRREKPVGSNMVERVCKTQAQIRADREAAREARTTISGSSQMKPLDDR